MLVRDFEEALRPIGFRVREPEPTPEPPATPDWLLF
jgi:hypothetical protein